MWRLLQRKPKIWLTRTHFKSQISGPITMFGKLNAEASGAHDSSQLFPYVNAWLKHAYWQIDTIREHGFKPILVLDEPLLPNFMGSAGTARSRKTAKLLRSLAKRLRRRGARVGIHCCNRISPAILADLGVDLIHFDAYHFPTQLARSRSELQTFLRSGGIIAWGIIPTHESLTSAMQARIEKDLNNILMSMESRGLPLRDVVARSMVAPTCGSGRTGADDGERLLSFAENLSRQIKRRYSMT